jgi:hypothetical protein
MSPILQGLANGSVRGYGGYLPLGASTAFESIASASGTGGSGAITFSSIPSTYQHLQLRIITRDTGSGTTNEDIRLRFNGISAASYARHNLSGDGANATAGSSTSQTYLDIIQVSPKTGTTANIVGAVIIDIHDYASSTKNKTVRSFGGADLNGSGNISLQSGLFVDTNAISQIEIFTNGVAFETNSRFALYGIKGA